MVSTARIGGIQTGLQCVDGFFVDIAVQGNVQIVGVQGEDVIFQAVISVQTHFCNGDGRHPVGMADAHTKFLSADTAGNFNQIIFASVFIGSLTNGDIGNLLLFAGLVLGINANASIVAGILGLCQRNHTNVVSIVQCDADTAVVGVGCAVIPVVQTIVGRIIVIKHTKSAVAAVQRAVFHRAGSMSCRGDMCAQCARAGSEVNQLEGGQLRGCSVCGGGFVHGAGRAFAEIIGAGDINFIHRIAQEIGNGAAVGGQTGNRGIGFGAFLTVVYGVGIRILHVFPLGVNASEQTGQS